MAKGNGATRTSSASAPKGITAPSGAPTQASVTQMQSDVSKLNSLAQTYSGLTKRETIDTKLFEAAEKGNYKEFTSILNGVDNAAVKEAYNTISNNASWLRSIGGIKGTFDSVLKNVNGSWEEMRKEVKKYGLTYTVVMR